jgi:hypothetical protein
MPNLNGEVNQGDEYCNRSQKLAQIAEQLRSANEIHVLASDIVV